MPDDFRVSLKRCLQAFSLCSIFMALLTVAFRRDYQRKFIKPEPVIKSGRGNFVAKADCGDQCLLYQHMSGISHQLPCQNFDGEYKLLTTGL